MVGVLIDNAKLTFTRKNNAIFYNTIYNTIYTRVSDLTATLGIMKCVMLPSLFIDR